LAQHSTSALAATATQSIYNWRSTDRIWRQRLTLTRDPARRRPTRFALGPPRLSTLDAREALGWTPTYRQDYTDVNGTACAQRELLTSLGEFEIHFFTSDVTLQARRRAPSVFPAPVE
jgi:hypothetical protein